MSGQEPLFGTDGIRAKAGQGPLEPARVRALGRALVRVLRGRGIHGLDGEARPIPGRGRVLLGRDPRGSGPAIVAALAEGITESGVDLTDAGVIPTPGVAWLCTRGGYDLGVVVSASHNPAEYNGIKLFAASGYKVTEASEREVEAELGRESGSATPGSALAGTRAADRGSSVEDPDAWRRYVEAAAAGGPDLRGWKLALDCAHGATWRTAPECLRALGADVICIGAEPDGRNINAGVGSTHPEALAALVRERGARLGLAFDGDGDRVILADETGTVRDGDPMLGIWGRHLAAAGKLPGRAVVSTVMANLGLERFLESAGIALERTQVGDRWVVEALLASSAVLGGEQSGHVVHFPASPTGDGLLTAIGILGVLAETGAGLAELAADVPKYPQVLHNVEVRRKPPVGEVPRLREAMEEAERELGRSGRLVVRYSGTEPLLRVMIEGTRLETIERHAQAICRVAREALGVGA